MMFVGLLLYVNNNKIFNKINWRTVRDIRTKKEDQKPTHEQLDEKYTTTKTL